MVGVDYIFNGQGSGAVANRLLTTPGADLGAMRPYLEEDRWGNPTGRSVIAVNAGMGRDGKPTRREMVTNTPSLLRKNEWEYLDRTILTVARPELRVWGDVVNAGLTYTVPNGMGTMVLQHQTMSDAGYAGISIDGMRENYRDRPAFDIASIPLPITHGEFSFSLREIMVSRNGGTPIDTVMAEQEARRVAEITEKLTLGTLSSYSYAGGTIYGLTNTPARVAKTLTLPTDPSWTPQVLVDEILDMIQAAQDVFFNGPYALWFSYPWTKYLDNDYSTTYNGDTLRTRLGKIDNINWLRKVDYLSGFQVLLVQMDPRVIQAVTGMPMTTIQWESHGGLQINFKIMCIMIPRIRSNASGNTGIIHGVAA